MPHAVLRLAPTVNTTETPALNENQGISLSNLIRFQADTAAGTALVQKLGGWTKFYPSAMPAVVRALWGWEDINNNSWLAVGTQEYSSRALLAVIENGTLTDITPTLAVGDPLPGGGNFTTTIGSSIVQCNIGGAWTTANNVVFGIQMAIGGLILYGSYQTQPPPSGSGSYFTINAVDILGNPTPATTSDPGTAPSFSTVVNTRFVTVTLKNSAAYYTAGNTFPILIPVTVGGLTLQGDYLIQENIDADNFTILASTLATSTASYTPTNVPLIINGVGASQPAGVYQISTSDWTLDNFGEDLVACPTDYTTDQFYQIKYQPIFIWSPDGQQPTATTIPQAPIVNDGAFVAMPQRQIVAWGSTQTGIQDPLLINWCDVNNYNQWIALPTNQAGSYRIPKGSRIVAGMQGPQQALIWTDIDVWTMQYVGTPDVYSFNEVGTGCGLIGRKAAAFINGVAFWMGPSQFYTYAADGVQPVPCPVWDVVFQNMNTSAAALTKIRAAVNSRFGEIAWYYCSAGSIEVDSYVKFNVYLGLWDYGSLGRSAWIDQSVLGPPIGADPVSLYLYQHETSNDADGTAMQPFFQTGYGAIAEGDFKAFVDLVWPDMRWGMWDAEQDAAIQITFVCTDYPGDTPVEYGPYTVTQATQFFNTRLRTRLMAVRVSSDDLGSFWRIGAIRYRYAQDGKF